MKTITIGKDKHIEVPGDRCHCGECSLLNLSCGPRRNDDGSRRGCIDRGVEYRLEDENDKTDHARKFLKKFLGKEFHQYIDNKLAGDFAYKLVETLNVKEAGRVNMPDTLTAENGAKGLMIGEFSENMQIVCPECGGDEPGDDCDLCDGGGLMTEVVVISWTNIKSIYKMAVEGLRR